MDFSKLSTGNTTPLSPITRKTTGLHDVVPHSQYPKVMVVKGTENKPMDPFPKTRNQVATARQSRLDSAVDRQSNSTAGNSAKLFSPRANAALNNANLKPNDRGAQIRAAKIYEGAANRVNRLNPASTMKMFIPGKEGLQTVPTAQRYAGMAGEFRSKITALSTAGGAKSALLNNSRGALDIMAMRKKSVGGGGLRGGSGGGQPRVPAGSSAGGQFARK